MKLCLTNLTIVVKHKLTIVVKHKLTTFVKHKLTMFVKHKLTMFVKNVTIIVKHWLTIFRQQFAFKIELIHLIELKSKLDLSCLLYLLVMTGKA